MNARHVTTMQRISSAVSMPLIAKSSVLGIEGPGEARRAQCERRELIAAQGAQGEPERPAERPGADHPEAPEGAQRDIVAAAQREERRQQGTQG